MNSPTAYAYYIAWSILLLTLGGLYVRDYIRDKKKRK